ncbi:MAG: hypothetical protein QNJ67_12960 [Kiloniellales bacterium]|nr:hypothetical protein [Kiloniellales bacterium]
MKRAGDLIFLTWCYLLASLAFSLFWALLADPPATDREARWAYLVWHLWGPLPALEVAWAAAAPARHAFLALALGGLVILPLLAAPPVGPPRRRCGRCALGLALWLLLASALAASPGLRSGAGRLAAEGGGLVAEALDPSRPGPPKSSTSPPAFDIKPPPDP